MGLPQRVFYPVHETAARWGCTISDIAGWAATGKLKIVTGIPPVACGDRDVGGLVRIEPTDILPIFRRCGAAPHMARIHRVQPLGTDDWHHITAPSDGVPVSVADLMILGPDVKAFEDTNELFGRIAEGAGLGDDGDYDWAAMHVEMIRRVFEEGLPESQAAWVRELQDWFSNRTSDGSFPDEKPIRLRVNRVLKALKFKHPKR
jgi:hypothetical protein